MRFGGQVKQTIGFGVDRSNSEESDLIVDLENGRTANEDDGVRTLGVSGKHVRKMLGRLRSGHKDFDRSVRELDRLSPSRNLLQCGTKLEILVGDVDGKAAGLTEMQMEKEKPKKMSSKKPPKPPCPPKGPPLSATDLQLFREMCKLERLRFARIQRKEMKKMRVEKASSSNANFVAWLITILFCILIVFQGILASRV